MKAKHFLSLFSLICLTLQSQAQIGPDALMRLDLLPQMRSQVHTGMFSSYDRTGGNDDGFSGKYSYIRKEGNDLVLAEMEGPGAIFRIHSPGPQNGIMEFYFDGEKTPRISMKFNDMLDGKHSPFLAPLVGGGVGGCYIYTPITYQKSCKVIVKAPTFSFYDINYVTYPENTAITTFQNPPTAEWLKKISTISDILNSTGSDITKYLVPEGTQLFTKKVVTTIEPGTSTPVCTINNPGRIVGLKLSPAKAFAGKERNIILNLYWDQNNQPAISCPVGDFFGYSFGEPAVKSLFSGTSDDGNYLYLPMPFSQSARIELVSDDKNGKPIPVQAEIIWSDQGKRADEGYLYAYWHRENPCLDGKPFTYLSTEGKGHVIGVFLQSQGKDAGNTWFFEGDDIVTLDGEMAIHGTGSEDSFNGGWYDVPARWEERASFPLSGCLDYKKYLGRTGGYRWLIADAYVFNKSIDYTIEHGPEGNLHKTDYTSVTFFYSSALPSANLSLPPVAARKVIDPNKIVFVPGWNVPIYTSPLKNAVIEKTSEQVAKESIRYFSFKTSGSDVFGTPHVSFIFDMPKTGKYLVSIKAIQGPGQGIVQLSQHDQPLGEPADLYSPSLRCTDNIKLGILDMSQGNNVVYFKLIGKNPASNGLNMKLVEVVFEWIK